MHYHVGQMKERERKDKETILGWTSLPSGLLLGTAGTCCTGISVERQEVGGWGGERETEGWGGGIGRA